MQSRIHKLNKSQIDYQTAQKQLLNDFQVNQYLKENQLQNDNMEAYTQLLNQLILHRKNIHKKCKILRSQKKSVQVGRDKAETGKAQYLCRSIEDIQQKISKQMQITNELQKEIIETKKSSVNDKQTQNLLKGDIGHLISRNQSAKLLSSKIAKVKIVAEDQLKRVGLALLKDREEIKLRNEMQQKFSKKLKNVSHYEVNNLSKLKKQYSQNFIKKKNIYQNLLSSQLVYQNNQSVVAMKVFNNQKNIDNNQSELFLYALLFIIKEMNRQNSSYSYAGHQKFSQQMTNIFNGILQKISESRPMIDKENLINQIVAEYNKIQESIKCQIQFYNELLGFKEEYWVKLNQLMKEINEIVVKYDHQTQEQYIINQLSVLNYQEKLKQFFKLLKVIFQFLSYFHKNITAQNLAEEHRGKMTKKSSFVSQEQTYEKPILIIEYISSLHNTYKYLSSSQHHQSQLIHQSEVQITSLYHQMLSNIKAWLYSEKLLINKNSDQLCPLKDMDRDEKEHHVFNIHFSEEQLRNSEKEVQNNYISKSIKSTAHYQGKGRPIQKAKQTIIKAERIKLLQNIDSDYYKIIKSTIKMQKQNTRKNYQFLRSFKRTKYHSRDNILEEKRFQSSFSNLFTKQINSNFVQQTNKFVVKKPRKTHHNQTSPKKIIQKSYSTTPDYTIFKHKPFSDLPKARLTQKLKIALQFS